MYNLLFNDFLFTCSSIIMDTWKNASRTLTMLEWGVLVKPWQGPMKCKFSFYFKQLLATAITVANSDREGKFSAAEIRYFA